METLHGQERRSFVGDVSLTLTSRGVGIFISLLASIVVARYVGPGGKGVLAILGVVSGIVVQLGNFGLHASTTYFVARDQTSLPQVASNCFWFGIAIGTALSMATWFFYQISPGSLGEVPPSLLIVTLLSIPFLFNAMFFQNILLGLQRIRAYNLVDLVGKAVGLFITILLLMVLGGGIWELVVAGLIVGIGMSFTFIVLVLRDSRLLLRFDHQLFFEMLRYGLKSYIACFLAFLIIRLDMLLVNYFLGVDQAGLYSVTVSLTDLFLLIPMSIGAMLFPVVSANARDDGSFTSKVVRHTVFLTALVCVALAVFAEPLIIYIYGPQFRGSIQPFLFLLPGAFALSIETIFMNDFAGRGLPPVVYISPAIALGVNLVLNLTLIPQFGIVGASVASTIAYSLLFLISLFYFMKVTHCKATTCLIMSRDELADLVRQCSDILRRQPSESTTS